MFRLDQKIAFVTGAGSGIGEQIARLFAQQGARVILADISLDAAERVAGEIQEAGGSARVQQLDVVEESQVRAAIERVAATEGRLDILVNNAGISHVGNILETSLQDWERVMRVNAGGVFLCAREAQKMMVPAKYGKMVFLSSTSALGNRGQTNYSTAKAGLQGMARTLAIELGPFNINVNAVAPGFVETRMTRQTAERMGIDFEAFKLGAASQIPLQRIGQPVDIANVIAFLCSDESSFVSGQTVYVRGGP